MGRIETNIPKQGYSEVRKIPKNTFGVVLLFFHGRDRVDVSQDPVDSD